MSDQWDKYAEKAKNYSVLFGSTLGKEILADIESGCCVNRSTLATDGKGAVDPLVMAYNEGRRSVVLDIRRILLVSENPQKWKETRRQVASE